MAERPRQEAIDAFKREDYDAAYPVLRRYAEKGDAEAQCLIGNYFELGLGRNMDFAEAKRWYLKASQQGHGLASNHLGTLCVLEGNSEQAQKWYAKAKEQGFERRLT